jgi:hypothetical protein
MIDIRFNDADMETFQQQIGRLQIELGDTPQDAGRQGMIALLQSMRASTKQAPRRRPVKASKTARRKRFEGNRIFNAEAIDRANGGIKRIQIFAPDLATAKLHPRAQIKKWGLARASWGWAMQELFGGSSGARSGLSRPAGSVETKNINDTKSGYYECFVTNKLNYISRALMGGRGPAVNTAMARAANVIKGRIQHRINVATRNAGW